MGVFSDVITFFEYFFWTNFVLEAGIKEEKASLFKIKEGLIRICGCYQIMKLIISLLKYGKLAFKPGIIHFSTRKKGLLIKLIRRSINEIEHSKEAIAEISFVMQAYIIKIFLLLCRSRRICFKENKQVKPTKR